MRLLHTIIILILFSSSTYAADSGWYRNGFESYGSPWASLPAACDGICSAFNGTTTVCEVDATWADGTPKFAKVNCSAGGGGSSYLTHDDCVAPEVYNVGTGTCAIPAPACPPGQTQDPVTGLCFLPPTCTAGNTYDGNFVTTPAAIAECVGGCQYQPTTFNSSDGVSGYWTYVSDGVSCAGPTGNPTPTPDPATPPPTPETPITPTTPEPSLQTDPNAPAAPATDKNQQVISQQIGGIQKQLQNLEKGTGSQITQGNQQVSLLQQIADSVKGQGTGTSGDGTGDQNSDGTDDFFADAQCTGGPPPCNGPAIECAIAQQAYFVKCNLQMPKPDIKESDVMASVGVTQTLEQYFDPSSPSNNIDVSDSFTPPPLNISACPPDYAVNTQFGSFNISYSYLCDLGDSVRPLVLLSAWIIVGLMFYGSLMRGW